MVGTATEFLRVRCSDSVGGWLCPVDFLLGLIIYDFVGFQKYGYPKSCRIRPLLYWNPWSWGTPSLKKPPFTLRQSYVAIEFPPFIDVFPLQPPFIGDFQLPCFITGGYNREKLLFHHKTWLWNVVDFPMRHCLGIEELDTTGLIRIGIIMGPGYTISIW